MIRPTSPFCYFFLVGASVEGLSYFPASGPGGQRCTNKMPPSETTPFILIMKQINEFPGAIHLHTNYQ